MRNKDLVSSAKKIGHLYPIMVDYHGNIVDGQHRFSVDKKWKRVRLKHIRTEKSLLIARLISNVVRRSVPPKEKTELLERLGEIYLSEGVENGKIASKIADEIGMSYTWVIKYLPNNFKDKIQSKRRTGSVTRRVTGILSELLRPPKRKMALQIKNYGNTKFVSLILDKNFYEEFERNSMELGMHAEFSALKALEDRNENMKMAIALKKRKAK